MNKIAYCRVSTREQNLERQIEAMKKEGVEEKDIFTEYMSGKTFARPEYKRMLRKLKEGDLLVIKSIDRLGRNYTEILEQWRIITKEKNANIQVIDMPLLNTTAGQGDLTGIFISDLVLQILAYVAETERGFIKQRQAEGIAIAKKNGVRFGRPRKEMPEGFIDLVEQMRMGKIKKSDAISICGVSESTFYRRLREYENG